MIQTIELSEGYASVIENDPANIVATDGVEVATGGLFSCGIWPDGTLKCWGFNNVGQLGDGTTTQRDSPTVINLGVSKTAISVTAGGQHACALLNDRSIKCWGANYQGQVGDGTTGNYRTTPTPVDLGLGDFNQPLTALQVVAGGEHTCALTSDATVKCWGHGHDGQLGDGSTPNSLPQPGNPIHFGNDIYARSIWSGEAHSCAVLTLSLIHI